MLFYIEVWFVDLTAGGRMTVLEILGKRLADLRVRKGWSQYELARKAGVGQPTIWRLEKGRKKQVDVVIVRRLAKALGVGVDYLVGTDDPEVERKPAAVAEVGA
jgi:transcriptional regulator with XRE-family HTH domain